MLKGLQTEGQIVNDFLAAMSYQSSKAEWLETAEGVDDNALMFLLMVWILQIYAQSQPGRCLWN
jgi:hypothetical protein